MANHTVHPPLSPATFDEVYHALAPICRRLVARGWYPLALRWHLPSADYTEMVADAVNDSFTQTMASLHRFDENKGTLLRWLVVIARRRLRHLMGHAYRQQRWRADLDVQADPRSPSDTDPVLQRAQVDQVLARLHQRQAQVLHAHYLQSRSVRAIADDMAVTETVVQSLLQRGRGRFKEFWVQLESEPAAVRKECSP